MSNGDDAFDPTDAATDRDTKYRFFPVVRRGYPPQEYYDADDARCESTIDASGRLQVNFEVSGSGGPSDEPEDGSVPIDMYGPRHVTGLDTRQVVRMEPEPGTSNYPPNYFATVEFDAPDLPWLFSPVSDDTRAPRDEISTPQGRGFPWLCLVVVERTKDTTIEAAGTKPLPSLEVPVAELPPLDEAWAWAHGQTVGSPSQKSDASLRTAFGQQSNLTRSRLVSPRNLRANRRYVAAVVPTFEAGRKAGLGQPVESSGHGTSDDSENDSNGNGDDATRTMALAWDPAKTSAAGGSSDETVVLPLYHHWEFSTGERGDFEFLARELEPVNLSAGGYDVGFTDVDVTDPGPAVLDDLWTAPRADRTVRRGGALRLADSSADEYVRADELRELLNRPAEIEEVRDEFDHVIGPPIYGGRHAQVEELPATPPDDQQWLSTLNLHPGWRLAAAVGTGIVRDQQEQLMASAWEQVGEIRAANRLLAAAGLSREAMERKLRTLDGASDAWLAGFTGPMHDRVTTGNRTVGAHLDASATPRALTSAPFRRLTSESSRLTDRLEEGVDGPALLAGVVDGEFDVTSPADAPDGTGTAAEAPDARELCRRFGDWDVEEPEPRDRDQSVQALRDHLAEMEDNCSRLFRLLREIAASLREGDAVDERREQATDLWDDTYALTDLLRSLMIQVANEEESRDLSTVADDYTLATAKALYNTIVEIASRMLLSVREGDELEPADVRAAQEAVFELVAALADVRGYLEGERGSDLAYLGDLACDPDPEVPERAPPNLGQVADALDPVTGLIDRMEGRLDGVDLRARADPLDRVMAYPEFPDPMYADLKEASEDYLLPGAEEIPRDSVGALETNPQFIESFMVGLNQEMAAELRWRRYPTDSRGSYFRQFWDPSARVPKPDDEDLLKDITEIHTWDDKGPDRRAPSPLGSNVMTGATGEEDTQPGQGSEPVTNVVLVVRGELLRRYPETTIYATKAKSVARRDGTGTARVPEWPTAEETESEVDDTYHRFPIFRGELDPDVTFLGFDLTPEEATGEEETTAVVDDPNSDAPTDDLGWFFVLEEPPGEVRFGLDANQGDVDERPNGVTYTANGDSGTAKTDNPNENPERGWSGLSWGHLVDSESALAAKDNVSVYRDRPGEESWETIRDEEWTDGDSDGDVEVENPTIDREEVAAWGKNSAHMAYITWQRPVRIAIHADDLLPVDGDGNGGNGDGNGGDGGGG